MTGKQFELEVLNNYEYVIAEFDKDNYYLDDENSAKSLECRLNELHEENQSLKEENKFLKNKLKTYKIANQLLKESLNETKKYKDVLMNFDESKTIKIDKNNGTIELIDKEWK